MKPNYSLWKPPFSYDAVTDMVTDADGDGICELRPVHSKELMSIEDSQYFGQRIAELLNKDAEEKAKG